MAKMVEDAKATLDKSLRRDAQSAINDEMTIVRQQLDVQLHEAVERAIKVSMERVSESAVKKVVQQAADRTAAIVDEARRASDTNAENLDVKVRQAVEQAVSGVADQAAKQAAENAAAHNLKSAVDEAVERVIAQREASNPSLSILSSPDAAQQQLDQWKKNLEESAQGVRAQTIEAAQADAAAAKQRWNEEFEAAVNGASQNLSQKLGEASQAALAQVERAAERASRRASIAGAQARSPRPSAWPVRRRQYRSTIVARAGGSPTAERQSANSKGRLRARGSTRPSQAATPRAGRAGSRRAPIGRSRVAR